MKKFLIHFSNEQLIHPLQFEKISFVSINIGNVSIENIKLSMLINYLTEESNENINIIELVKKPYFFQKDLFEKKTNNFIPLEKNEHCFKNNVGTALFVEYDAKEVFNFDIIVDVY